MKLTSRDASRRTPNGVHSVGEQTQSNQRYPVVFKINANPVLTAMTGSAKLYERLTMFLLLNLKIWASWAMSNSRLVAASTRLTTGRHIAAVDTHGYAIFVACHTISRRSLCVPCSGSARKGESRASEDRPNGDAARTRQSGCTSRDTRNHRGSYGHCSTSTYYDTSSTHSWDDTEPTRRSVVHYAQERGHTVSKSIMNVNLCR